MAWVEGGFADVDQIAPRLLVGGDLITSVGATEGYTHWDDPDKEAADHEPGSDPRRQVEDLLARGVTHVLDVRVEWDDSAFLARWAPGIVVRHLGIDDAGQQVPAVWFDEGTSFALAALARPGTVVLAHCHAGINRGPSMGYAILLAQGVDPVEAFHLVKRGRPQAEVAYALDALRWHHERTRTDAKTRTRQHDAVEALLHDPDEIERRRKARWDD